MSRFHVLNEETEDTFESDGLQEAIEIIRGEGHPGDLFSILDSSSGKAIRQFQFDSDGNMVEIHV